MMRTNVLLDRLDEIARECGLGGFSLAERAAMYAGAEAAMREVRAFIDERAHGDAYAHEKIGNVFWHIGAAVGFDVDNGHPANQHARWAMGELSSLRSQLSRALKE